ncbi:hypothetical protein RMATCC62417_07338 [Rhizopus microsporus]|nr:hypothetical protein RMATCC62417_07338 [Rhizopus microsporus]
MPPTKEQEKQETNSKHQEDAVTEEFENQNRSPSPSPQKKSSKDKKKPGKRKKRSSKKDDALGLVKGDDTLGSVADTVDGVLGGGQQQSGKKGSDHPLSLRLDLNLDVEITLKARVHGDVTLALLA